MQTKTHRRRSREEWLCLIDQQKESGLSAPQFCKQHNIGYASFSAWKRQLQSDPSSSGDDTRASSPAQFIDLGSLSQSVESGWRITLKLGNGVELELSQN